MRQWVQLVTEALPALGAVPEPLLAVILTIIIATVILLFISILVMFLIWLERKVSAHMQDRLGPMRVGGWHGWAQSIADGVKLLFKEDIIPAMADRLVFKLSPMLIFSVTFMSFIVLPFSRVIIVSDLNVALIFILAMLAIEVVG